jgi:type II secretory pathway component PulL
MFGSRRRRRMREQAHPAERELDASRREREELARRLAADRQRLEVLTEQAELYGRRGA